MFEYLYMCIVKLYKLYKKISVEANLLCAITRTFLGLAATGYYPGLITLA